MEKKSRSAKVVGASKKAAVKVVAVGKKILSGVAGKAVSQKPGIHPEEHARRIQDKAYELFLCRGLGHGDDQADWFEAERIVRSELGL